MLIFENELKHKKNRSIKVVKYYKKECNVDIIKLNVYSSLINRTITGYNPQSYLMKKYSLYDLNQYVQVDELEDYIKVTYTSNSIKDEFLNESIKDEVLELFQVCINTVEFDEKELNIIKEDYKIYTKRYLENNKNIAKENLLSVVNYKENFIPINEFENHLKTITIKEINDMANKLINIPGFVDVVNITKNEIEKLDFKISNDKIILTNLEYKKADAILECRNLEQCYIAMGYKINGYSSYERLLANLILGGDVFSKLFKIIREEKSLSYSIGSSVSSRTSIIIEAGVNIEYKDIIEEEIFKIINILKSGDFQEEFETAKIIYKERLKQNSDKVSFINSLSQRSFLENEDVTLEKIYEKIDNIQFERIKSFFNDIEHLSTSIVY